MENSVTNRQMFFILFMTLTAIATVDISKVMMQSAGTSGWITILLTAALMAMAAYVWAKLNATYPGKMLFDYSRELVGKGGAYFLALYFTLYFLMVLVALTLAMANQLQTNFLPKTPTWATSLALMPVIGFVACKGVTNAARIIEIYGIILLCVAVPTHILMLFQGDINHILPLYNTADTGKVISGIKDMIFPFLGVEVLAIVPFTAKNGKKAARMAVITVLAVGLFYVLNALSCVMMIGENEIVYYNYPLISAIRQVHLNILKIFQRIDLLYLTVGFIALIAGLSFIYLNIVNSYAGCSPGSGASSWCWRLGSLPSSRFIC